MGFVSGGGGDSGIDGDGVGSGVGIDGVTDDEGVGRVSSFAGASLGGGVSLRVLSTTTTATMIIAAMVQTSVRFCFTGG